MYNFTITCSMLPRYNFAAFVGLRPNCGPCSHQSELGKPSLLLVSNPHLQICIDMRTLAMIVIWCIFDRIRFLDPFYTSTYPHILDIAGNAMTHEGNSVRSLLDGLEVIRQFPRSLNDTIVSVSPGCKNSLFAILLAQLHITRQNAPVGLQLDV